MSFFVLRVRASRGGGGPIAAQDTNRGSCSLDVYTPKKVYDDACSTGGAPVMVWIYGGGYTNGEKNGGGQYDPAGIIHASQVTGNDGVIFVALNYRVRRARAPRRPSPRMLT